MVKLRTKKLVGWLTILALVLMMLGVPEVQPAKASQLTKVKDVISDSDLGVVADHEIHFKTPSGVDSSTDTITLTFESGFNLGSVAYGDMDLEVDAACDGTFETSKTLADSATTSTWGATTSAQVITFTPPTDATSGEIATTSCVKVEIGTNADSGTNQITNPSSAASYQIDIGGNFGDTGTAMVAIIEDVTVTATVSATLTFTISGVASSTTIKDATTTVDTTATTIPFGTLQVGTSSVGAQTLAVTTNADDGFTVNVFQDQNLTSAQGSDIDCFDDGVCASTTASYAPWSSPAGTLGQENTYGHFGFTSEDNTLGTNCGSDDFSTNLWGGFEGTGQDEVMCHTGPADGSTEDKGQVKVGFQVEINALQEAGDYTNTLTYIATPTY